MEFENFINQLLSKSGINNSDKNELKYELQDHLNMLKQEYLGKGKSNEEAVQLAIKNFTAPKSMVCNLKNNLPSKNKYETFNYVKIIECICFMFLTFFISTLFSSYYHLTVNKIPFLLTIFISLLVILISLLFTITKLNNEHNFIKYFTLINILYFFSEKVITFISNSILKLTNSNLFIYKYSFSLNYVISYLFIFTILLISSKVIFKKFNTKFKNISEGKMIYIFLIVLSIILISLYFMVSTNPYLLHKVLNSIRFNDANNVYCRDNYIFYMILSNFTKEYKFIIPNVGLIILLITLIKVTMLKISNFKKIKNQ